MLHCPLKEILGNSLVPCGRKTWLHAWNKPTNKKSILTDCGEAVQEQLGFNNPLQDWQNTSKSCVRTHGIPKHCQPYVTAVAKKKKDPAIHLIWTADLKWRRIPRSIVICIWKSQREESHQAERFLTWCPGIGCSNNAVISSHIDDEDFVYEISTGQQMMLRRLTAEESLEGIYRPYQWKRSLTRITKQENQVVPLHNGYLLLAKGVGSVLNTNCSSWK